MIAELGLVLIGTAISTIVMAIGIGGGILWTPVLILVYHTSPQEAVATSILIQVVGLGSGSLAYLKAGLVEKKLALVIFLAALPGVVIGSYFTSNLSGESIQMALGIMAITLAILFVSRNEGHQATSQYHFDRSKVSRILPVPAFLGFAMGALSLGISEWLIPMLRNKLKLAMKRAIATMIAAMFFLAIVAACVHWSLAASIQTDILLWGSVGVVIGGQIGARISQRINEQLLKETFIYLMTLIGIHLVFQAI